MAKKIARLTRKAQVRAAQQKYREKTAAARREYDRTRPPRERKKAERRIIGVDGEGQDTPDGRHIYTYLAAVDEFGELVAEAYNENGLSHEECVTMLLSIPRAALKFGFMFSYDVTKIIEQMPAADRWYLMRPKARERRSCKKCKAPVPRTAKRCVSCQCKRIRKYTRTLTYKERSYDFFNGSLTVSGSRIVDGEVQKPRSTKVWDCFRFFGCAFVEALKDWQIGSPEQVERISAMKQKRGAFDQEDPESVKRYCQEECELLAQMMRKVIDAHEAAGIPLKRFDGAGSTATALLSLNKVADYKGPRHDELDPNLAYAIACAFFGGRFEDSVVGIVRKPVYSFDISSAYPYALSGLPCLACRGRWRFVPDVTLEEIEKSTLALAQFRVAKVTATERAKLAWCPLPFRSEKGSISYGTNFVGWAWAPELLPALRGWPDLVTLEGGAWLYQQGCDHQPFSFLPDVYRRRVAWGKEGAGKALKLGANASYGKTAQSVGDDPPFQSWIWAGMTTSIARGQILEAILKAEDPWNMLTVATDGIFSLEKLPIETSPNRVWMPRDTGTSDLAKPLGGWERKYDPVDPEAPSYPEGAFIAKPGLYYRLEPKLGDVRARGVGRREVHKSRTKLEQGFLKWDRKDPNYHVPLTSRRFYGAKHSIYGRSGCVACKTSWPGAPDSPPCYKCGQVGIFKTQMIQTRIDDCKCETCLAAVADAETPVTRQVAGRDAYGLWDIKPVKIAFDPYPKREREGLSMGRTYAYLTVRDLGGKMSEPYDVGGGTTSPEGMIARQSEEFAMEQADWD